MGAFLWHDFCIIFLPISIYHFKYLPIVKNILLLIIIILHSCYSSAQSGARYQYFDGADTVAATSVFIHIDTTGGNAWQIGRPQKTIFHSAATAPNALITDTLNPYPPADTSSFTFGYQPDHDWGVAAIRWKQKLDLDRKHDWGRIDYSLDTGTTWQNVFGNPSVYNFYGFALPNRDTIAPAQYAFTGSDTAWKDIWICFDWSDLFSHTDSLLLRFTLISDTVDSLKEGWMIDNIMVHTTFIHGLVKDPTHNADIRVFPNITSGLVNIEAPKAQKFHITEQIAVLNTAGQLVKEYRNVSTKYFIDLGDLPNGLYYVKVKTNLYSGTYPVMLTR